MIINTNMGSKDSGSFCQSPAVHYTHFPTSREIPAPPPPPPPIHTLCEPPQTPTPRPDPKRRLRSFNWEAIPMERVKGGSSLWSSETFPGDLQIDTLTLEDLFRKHEEEIPPRNFNPRRSIPGADLPLHKVFLLDSRRSMNVSILLRQFKRSAAQMVEDVRRGRVEGYSSERLTELLKHLPDRDEVQRLRSFQGDRQKLSDADLFMLLLMDVPSYALRLESLILKKDFHPAIVSQLSAARELKTAAEELLQCPELHFILKLVLKAGNFMNAGGYAGNAAGFRVSSLLKLADTKANKPGMTLLHFVVMEVQKKDPKYLSFADSLKHVQSASRLSEENLLEDFDRLQSRVVAMQKNVAAHEEEDLRRQMEEFLEDAEEQLRDVQREAEDLRSWKRTLVDFLCEDEETFRMEECCKIFSCFCQKFQTAIKENKVRELEEQRRLQWERKRLQKRHSMATCGSLEAHRAVDDLELTLERNLGNLCRTPSGRLCRMRSLGWHSPRPFVPQRERIRGNDDQKNAQQMRETSERVLRQQMEYKRTLSPEHKANFYPGSKIPVNSNFQTKADIKGSPPEDRAEISPPSLEIEELEPRVGTQPVLGGNHQKPQHVSRLGYPYSPSLPDDSSPARCLTKAEILQPSGLSCQPLNYEGPDILGPFLEPVRPRQTFDMTPKGRNPLDGAEISRQSPLHLPCGHQSQTHPNIETRSQVPHMSGSIILGQGLVTQCETIPEIANDGIEVTKYSIDRNGHGTQRRQTQPKIPGFPPGFETLKPRLTHSDSQNFIQFSMKSSPESGKKSAMKSNAQQGISMWNNQRDHRNSPISKMQPDKKKEVAEPETPNPSDGDSLDLESSSLSTPETSRLSELEIRPEIHEQSLNSIRTKNNDLKASIPSVPSPPSETLPGMVQEERQRSSESSRTSNHNPEHVQQTLPGLVQEERQRSSESSRTSNHNPEHVQQTLPGMVQEERQRSSTSLRTSNHNPEHVQQTLPGLVQEERQRSSESSRTSNHNPEHVQQTLPGLVQEERQRSSESSRTSNHNPEHVQQTLPGLVQEERQRSSESSRTSNHNPEHVQQTLPGLVQEERQRSSTSSRTSNHNPEHVQQTLPGLVQEERQRSSESSRTSNHNPEHVQQTLPGLVQEERQRSSTSSRTSNHNPEHVQQTLPGLVQEERQRSSTSSRTSNHNLEHVQQTLPGMVQEERQRSSTSSRTSNHNPEHVQQTLPGMVQEERQRSSTSSRTSNHNPEHVQQTLAGLVQEERQRSPESSRTFNHNPEHVQQTLPGLVQEERQRSPESSRTFNHNPEHVQQTLPGLVQEERQRSSESSRTSNHNPEHVQQTLSGLVQEERQRSSTSSRTSNHNPEHVQQTLPGLVQEERQRSSESSRTSNHNPEHVQQTLPGLVQEERQRSSESSRTSNQHNLEHVQQPILSTFPDQSETLPHTLVHLHPETLREDRSPTQSTLQLPKQYTVKSFKQTLVKSSPKNSRHSVSSTSGPSLVQPRSDTCNPNPTPPKAELSRTSQPKPGCYMSRIKQVDHLAIKLPAKDMNGQVAPPPHNVVEPTNDASRALQSQDMDYNYYPKGLKDAPVQREAQNPCSKWKRELRRASESAESKVESGNVELNKDSPEQKTADHPKTSSLGRTGSGTSKKTKNDLGIRRVFTNKDVALGSIHSIVTKHPGSTKPANTETRDSKIPQKVSAGPAKPPATKPVGCIKEKRESGYTNHSDSSRSERKNSLTLASRPPAASSESPGHGVDHGKDPAWPSKKTNSVARVAVHVIKHYEVNSTLTRGARGPYLTTHPVWR